VSLRLASTSRACIMSLQHTVRTQTMLRDLDAAYVEGTTCRPLHSAMVLALGVANHLKLAAKWPRHDENGNPPLLFKEVPRAVSFQDLDAILNTNSYNDVQSRIKHFVVAECAPRLPLVTLSCTSHPWQVAPASTNRSRTTGIS
jgi:hypothetical protein